MAYVINENDGIDGTATAGRKGLPYDWQQLLIPTESEFNTELVEMLDSNVVASAAEGSIV